jgi:WD40 repeat protein
MAGSDSLRRRQLLMDRFLAGDIDKATYDRMLAEIEQLEQSAQPARAPEQRAPAPAAAPAGFTGELRAFQGHPGPVHAVAFSPDGRRAASAGGQDAIPDADKPAEYAVRLWDINSGQNIRRFQGHAGSIRSLAYSSDGYHLLTGSHDGTARLWDVESGWELKRFEVKGSRIASVALSSDGALALTGSANGLVHVWDVEAGTERGCFKGHIGLMTAEEVRSVALSRDGRWALSGGHSTSSSSVILWEAETLRVLRKIEEEPGLYLSVAFAPDSRRLLTVSTKVARLWDAESGTELMRLEAESTAQGDRSAAISPDGRRALTTGEEESVGHIIQVSDLVTGRKLCHLAGHRARIPAVAVSPDGRYALSGSEDCSVRLWRLPK